MNRSASVCRTRDKGINSRDKGIKDSNNNSKRTVNRDKGNSQVNNKPATDNKGSRGNKGRGNNRDSSQGSKISAVNKDNNQVKVRDNSKPAIINKDSVDSKVRGDNRDKGNNQGSKVKVNKDRGKVRDSNKVSAVRDKGRGSKMVVRTVVAVSVRVDNTTRTECPEAEEYRWAEIVRPVQKSANGCVKLRSYANN